MIQAVECCRGEQRQIRLGWISWPIEHWQPSCVKADRGYLQLIAALLSVCQELDDEGYSCPKVLAKAPAHRSAAPCSHTSVLHPPCHVQQSQTPGLVVISLRSASSWHLIGLHETMQHLGVGCSPACTAIAPGMPESLAAAALTAETDKWHPPDSTHGVDIGLCVVGRQAGTAQRAQQLVRERIQLLVGQVQSQCRCNMHRAAQHALVCGQMRSRRQLAPEGPAVSAVIVVWPQQPDSTAI